MPWCPKCKTEYREGFNECSDCDVELVDGLEQSDDENNSFGRSRGTADCVKNHEAKNNHFSFMVFFIL